MLKKSFLLENGKKTPVSAWIADIIPPQNTRLPSPCSHHKYCHLLTVTKEKIVIRVHQGKDGSLLDWDL